MKEKLNELMKEFLNDCEDGDGAYYSKEYKPTFNSFIAWLDDRTWNMEKEK